MNFIESLADYVLENQTAKDLPKIGLIALSENLESEATYILSGMNSKDNQFEILQYFNQSLLELNVVLPSKIEASKILTKYYLNEIVNNPSKAFELMIKLDNEVYMQVNWTKKEMNIVGKELNIEHLYTWYREIQDWQDNDRLLYYLDINKEDQLKKYKEHLVLEAKKALNNFYK